MRSQKSDGIVPDNMFSQGRKNTSVDDNWESSGGSVPVRRLEARSAELRLSIAPTSVGIVPVILVPKVCNSNKFDNRPNSDGMVPIRSGLSPIMKDLPLDIIPTSVGMVPLSLFKSIWKKRRLLNNPYETKGKEATELS